MIDSKAVVASGARRHEDVYVGPFAGIGVSKAGDSLAGAILFDAQLGVQVRPGVTARFVAGRARREAR